jgi:hypothetical protein
VHTHLHSKHDDAHHQNEKPIDKNAIVVKGVSDYLAFNNESLHKDSKVNKSRNLYSKMGGKTHSKQNAQVLENTSENGTKKNPTLVNRAQNLQLSKTQIVNKKQRRRKNNGTSQLGMPTTSIDASTNGTLGWGKRMQLGANERNNNNMMTSMSEVVEDSHVLVKQSMNPYFDFKHSMMLMIREEHLEVKIVAIHPKNLLTLIDFNFFLKSPQVPHKLNWYSSYICQVVDSQYKKFSFKWFYWLYGAFHILIIKKSKEKPIFDKTKRKRR